jgi:branched-chain amino acid transport system permease protein
MTLVRRRPGWWAIGLTLIAIAVWLAFNFNDAAAWYERYGVVVRQAAATGLLIGGVYGLVALGLTLIFGVLNIINFAHGALMTIGLYLSFILFDRYGIDPYLSLFITMPVLFLIGLFVQRLVIHPTRDAPHSNQLLLTLGLSLLIENALLVAFTATPRAIRLDYGRGPTPFGLFEIDFPLRIAGTTITHARLMAFIGALVLTGLLYLLLQRTDLGKAIRATAQEKEGAALVGIDIHRINMITFGIGTACVGAAAALVLPFLAVDPTAGSIFNITAFVIVVLGGMGSVVGALAGGIVIGLTQEMWIVFFPGTSKLLGVFIIFILVLLLRPQGLFGGRRS